MLFALIESTGVIGVLLLLLGLFTFYEIVRETLFFFWLDRNTKKYFQWQKEEKVIKRENFSLNPLLKIIWDFKNKRFNNDAEKKAYLTHVFHKFFNPLMKRVQLLRLISVISPLLGLMGTIFGIMGVFELMSNIDSADPASFLAGGIWEALITTIMGLSVAIPALVAFYIMSLRLKQIHLFLMDELYYCDLNSRE